MTKKSIGEIKQEIADLEKAINHLLVFIVLMALTIPVGFFIASVLTNFIPQVKENILSTNISQPKVLGRSVTPERVLEYVNSFNLWHTYYHTTINSRQHILEFKKEFTIIYKVRVSGETLYEGECIELACEIFHKSLDK